VVLCIVNSYYHVILSDYNKSGNYILEKWNFAQALTGTGASCTSSSCPITDAQIQSILLGSYRSLFPTPTCLITSVHFLFYAWKGYSVNQGGSYSCVQFCSNHGAIRSEIPPAQHLPIPGFHISGSDGPCGYNTLINNMFSVMSHEIGETVSNPESDFKYVRGTSADSPPPVSSS